MKANKECEQIFIELHSAIIKKNTENIINSLEKLLRIISYSKRKNKTLSLESRSVIYDLFERSPQQYKIDGKFINKFEREASFYRLLEDNNISVTKDIQYYFDRIAQYLNDKSISIIDSNFFNFNDSLSIDSIWDTIGTNTFDLFISRKVKENQTQVSKSTKNTNSTYHTFEQIFTIKDYTKYLDALIFCKPQLLKKENKKYIFIGNEKKHRGCLAQWFKDLKIKGIINQSINRNQLADVLKNEIGNFSISGSSIDNQSNTYNDTFEKQFIEYINNN